MNSHDRVEVLEEVVDASTVLLSFFAAERIEMKSTIGALLCPPINDGRPGDAELSLTEQFLSEGLKVSEEQLKQSEAKCAAAEQNVAILQQAVKDHVKQEKLAEEKITWLEKELERLRPEGNLTNLDLIEMQTNEIDNLRKDLSSSQSRAEDLKQQLAAATRAAENPQPELLRARIRELEADIATIKTANHETVTELDTARAALLTTRREADESAQKVEELTRQAASSQGDFVEGAERGDQLSDVEGRLSREVEQLREKMRKIHVHLTRALRKFEDDPDMTIRAIDSALKLAGKA